MAKSNMKKGKESVKKEIEEFRKFAFKGNIMDLAVAVIIGGAFGKIVSSLVSDIVMPLFSLIIGNVKIENLFVALDGNSYASIEEASAANAATLNYGLFLTAIIDFLIISLSIFIFLQQISRINKKISKNKPAPAPTTKECVFCKSPIHIEAVKCPQCTSDLPQVSEKQETVE